MWNRLVLCAQVRDQIGDVLIRYGITERGHFLAAIEDLAGDLFRGPGFVFGKAGKRGRLFGADASVTMAVGAAFVAKQDGTCLFFITPFYGGMGDGTWEGSDESKEEEEKTGGLLPTNHIAIFSCQFRPRH